MDHATCFRFLSATHFATSSLPLTVRLIPVLTEIGRLIVGFRRAFSSGDTVVNFSESGMVSPELGTSPFPSPSILAAYPFPSSRPRFRLLAVP